MSALQFKARWGWGFILLILVLGGAGMLIRTETSEPISMGFRAVAALLLVLGLTFVGAHWARRWSQRAGIAGSSSAQSIHVLGVKGLGNGQSLLVVEVAGERFLLGASRDNVVNLAHLSAGEGISETISSAGARG